MSCTRQDSINTCINHVAYHTGCWINMLKRLCIYRILQQIVLYTITQLKVAAPGKLYGMFCGVIEWLLTNVKQFGVLGNSNILGITVKLSRHLQCDSIEFNAKQSDDRVRHCYTKYTVNLNAYIGACCLILIHYPHQTKIGHPICQSWVETQLNLNYKYQFHMIREQTVQIAN